MSKEEVKNWEIVNINDIKKNPNNPRVLKDDKFNKLKKSIKEFPEMLKIRPIVVNEDMVVLGGNMRLQACKAVGLKELPIIKASNLTEEQQREFIIKDNVGFGEWDWDMIANEWDTDLLEEWGLDGFPFDTETELEAEKSVKLQDKFIVPPFSILDTRQGYWQDRKRYWKELIGDNGESREGTLYKSKGDVVSEELRKISNGVSVLDPVLAEISNRWFGIENGNTFDCFAGDSVFGYVSDALGNKFTGIELRQEQADLNNLRLKGSKSKYICDDGQNVIKHIEPNSQDLLFSCPPYFDLEVYSDLKNDASNQKEYKDFLKILYNAFTDSIKCLKDNRFAVITVGDVRNKEGFYYRFVDDIKDIFKANGVNLLNELILVESVGTGRLRANPNMIHRKVVKMHQNVLIFYKGNPKEIKNIYPKLDFSDITIEDESTDI